MKKFIIALVLLVLVLQAALAQADMQLYVAEETISRAQADGLARLISDALGEPVALEMQAETGASLDSLILADRAPHLAIVAPYQALPWAREGLLLPLEGCVENTEQMAEPVLGACVFEEQLVIAPLLARHRQMAVRVGRLNAVNMGYLLDERSHPVWYPSETVQVLDELAMLGDPGMEVWTAEGGGAAAIEALLQGVSGLRLADEMSDKFTAEESDVKKALEWLEDMTRAGLIGVAPSREEALENFLAGRTAVFIDWTDVETKAHAARMEKMEIVTIPYPSTTGMLLRSFELIGVCAIRAREAEENALSRRAVNLLSSSAQAQLILGERAIRRDGADWLPPLAALDYGPTLRRLLGRAVSGVLEGGVQADASAREIVRAMEALAQ